ncbi:MAG: glycosyltransferase [Nitrospirota bacterium]
MKTDTSQVLQKVEEPERNEPVDISVIVPVVERYDDLEMLYLSYAEEIEKLTENYEFIFVIDGHMESAYKSVKRFSRHNPKIRVIKFMRPLGESAALATGCERASGTYIFTLSSYFQVEPDGITEMYRLLINDECDIVITRRDREKDSFFNRVQSFVFHKILRILTGANYRDISCGLRGMRREMVGVFDIYGDLHRFIPVLAEHRGLRIKEVVVKQRKEDTKTRFYGLRTYLHRIIDLMNLFFLLRFTFKPLRFFGIIGSMLTILGSAIILYLIYRRLFTEGFGLSDKPSLFVASILIVIGIQIFAIGLVGEIIIYTRSRRSKPLKLKKPE